MPMNRLASKVINATSVDEVVAAAREYLAALPAAELSRIPLECRPTWLVDDEALLCWSAALTARRSQPVETARRATGPLETTEAFFATAASRVRELRGFPGVPPYVGDNRPHVA